MPPRWGFGGAALKRDVAALAVEVGGDFFDGVGGKDGVSFHNQTGDFFVVEHVDVAFGAALYIPAGKGQHGLDGDGLFQMCGEHSSELIGLIVRLPQESGFGPVGEFKFSAVVGHFVILFEAGVFSSGFGFNGVNAGRRNDDVIEVAFVVEREIVEDAAAVEHELVEVFAHGAFATETEQPVLAFFD